MDHQVAQHRAQFYQEARDILDRLNDDILKAEAAPENEELLNSIFRGVHTIKGSAGVFDMEDISQFSHHLEGILNALREGRVTLTPELVDLILAGADHIGKMVSDYAAGRPAEGNDALVESFKSFQERISVPPPEPETAPHALGSPGGSGGSSMLSSLPDEPAARLAELAESGLRIFKATLHFTSEMLEHGYDPMVLLRNLKEAAAFYYAVTAGDGTPPLQELEPLSLYLHPVVYVATEATEEAIASLAFDPSLMRLEALSIGPAKEDGEGSGALGALEPEAFAEFRLGAMETVEALEKAVISFEGDNSRESLNKIFRLIHTLKGDSDYLGLTDLTVFAHALESLLERLRSGSLPRTTETVDIILQAVDFLKQGVVRICGKRNLGAYPPVYGAIQALLEKPARPMEERGPLEPKPSDELGKVFVEQAIQYKEMLTVALGTKPLDDVRRKMLHRGLDGLLQGARLLRQKTLEQLARQALSALDGQRDDLVVDAVEEVVVFVEGLDKAPKRIGEFLVEDGKLSEKDLRGALSRQKPLGKILIEEGKVSEEDVARALKKQELMEAARQIGATATAEPEMRTMRVDERKIETFNNIVGELLIARNTYDYLLSQFRGMDSDLRTLMKQFRENLHLISRLTNEMHHGVLSLRMIPIRNIFQKFNRVARDISRKQKKRIALITDGEEIEIDKKVADILTDPLVHIVRNACDHAIEPPQERVAAGKPETGTVLLRASQEGRNLIIRVIDDGKGIDRQRLHDKAREAGMAVPSSLEDPSLLDLIFVPGLSTKTEVTDISGRGVGMDVVRTTALELGGTVHVASEEGKGTEIALTLPMAMGISAALLVQVDQGVYAVPLDAIVETLKIAPRKLRRAAGGGLIFHYRGEVLPAEWLDSLLDVGSGGPIEGPRRGVADRTGESAGELAVVVVKASFGRFGLLVDRLIKNMELAIKPVPQSLASIDVISGVSIMGDGKILLVLNPEKIIRVDMT